MMGQEHIRNVALIDGAEIAAAYEPDAGMCGALRAFAPEVQIEASMSDLLRRSDLDALLIASPNQVHARQLSEIANTRPLPILVEKPLYTDPGDSALIESLSAEYPSPIWVAMEYRYMPPIAAFIQRAQAATGGIKMLTIREHRFPFLPKVGNWNRFNKNSGGTLVEKCCHFFDLMRVILQDEPVRVMASGGQDVNHLDEVYDGENSDIWDGAYVIVDFASGTRAMLDLCMYAEGSEYQEELSAVGPEGKIECFVPGPGRFWPENQPNPIPKLVLSPRHTKQRDILDIPVDPKLLTAGDHNGATFYQHQRFLDVVRGKAAPEVTLSDGAKAVQMGMAAQQSALTGQSVSL
ncbi:Oxidoreductase, NAD(P)-dependent [Candidatus Rhodobacter oscarellae]|uniref:Oxidoreductase, NAD(P)-dependent n=2 Tax=Candidatus Rhodobacter oscarellae TaxID=1675527 RepID=A0A0J9E0L2_9RHOB|nr:Oxidoreductase, NAD(P)-dependent [Candidatus Rhodobacter lobularis]